MASIGHIFVEMAAGRGYARADTTRMIAAWMIRFTALSLLPDLDAVSFILGIPYGAPWGHRGATHFFFPWQPLPVAPIGPRLFAEEGRHVLLTETVVFAPLLLYALVPRRSKRS